MVPELRCSDFERSLRFYCEVLGFSVAYERTEERFACLALEGAQIMIEQPVDEDRAELLLTGALEKAYGRGVNLQIEVSDVEAMAQRIIDAGWPLLLGIEDRWYRVGEEYAGSRQFWVQDVDGYLLRFFENLGWRAEPQ